MEQETAFVLIPRTLQIPYFNLHQINYLHPPTPQLAPINQQVQVQGVRRARHGVSPYIYLLTCLSVVG